MGRYLIRRVLFMILVLFIVSLLTFTIFLKLPGGDVARRMAGPQAQPEQIASIRRNLGLDKPFWVQYGKFAKGLIPLPGVFLNEDVYYSYRNAIPVKDEIFRRLPITITLAIGAAIFWLLIGIPIGIASAVRRRSVVDRAGMLFALFGVSAPVFWLGYIMLFIFWFQLGWAPPPGIDYGETLPQAIFAGKFILPWITLSLLYAAFYARMVRGNLIETLGEDYIRTARAKGLTERRVVYKHGLRAGLTPVVTMLGVDLGYMFGGLLITETVFDLDGIGKLAIQGIRNGDFPTIMGVTVFAAFFVVIANLLVDVLYAALDPRVRYT